MQFTMWNALTVSTLLLATCSVAAPSEWLVPRGDTLVGCYNSSLGMSNKTSNEYQSSGWCQVRCMGNGAAAFALTGRFYCLCGDELPPSSDKVDSSNCDTPCPGYPQDKCGADDYYSVYTTGLEGDVQSYSASTTSSSSSSNSTASETGSAGVSTTVNSAGQTVYVTDISNNEAAAGSAQDAKQSKSPNTAAIAAGVVVGVVGVAALVGAAFFFYRSRKQKAQGYLGGRDSGLPPMSDSRYDGQYMAQRRQSNGSIDDDQDFSRRILQVTNPDR
ncbi:hypothetical protein N7486_010743 [Penicillium sp. IBT 16267x]|nr:hypothetical protein N7486_010743 [Penicillium sp. IBT 16267x]